MTGPSTRTLYVDKYIDPLTGSTTPPTCENVAFAYDDLESWKAVALGEKAGYIYSRSLNPTARIYAERMAALEGAEAGLSFSTGMAAISTTLFALLSEGKRVVAVKDCYGGTYLHFTQILPRYGIVCDVLETDDEEAILAAIAKGCDLVYLESPTNPTLKIIDLEKLSRAAHQVDAVVIVDNTFATPINQLPLGLGADLSLHSASKYLGGHGDVMGGVVCGSKHLMDFIYRHRELTGTSLDAHRAHVLMTQLKTLGLRVERQNENALAIAKYLEEHPKVLHVNYPGLESHPRHDVAKRQMSGFGGVLSFEVHGGLEAIAHFLPKLKYAYMAANLGQVETVVGPPGLTSHVELSPEERAASGVPEGLVRYAVGVEDIADLKKDLEEALTYV